MLLPTLSKSPFAGQAGRLSLLFFDFHLFFERLGADPPRSPIGSARGYPSVVMVRSHTKLESLWGGIRPVMTGVGSFSSGASDADDRDDQKFKELPSSGKRGRPSVSSAALRCQHIFRLTIGGAAYRVLTKKNRVTAILPKRTPRRSRCYFASTLEGLSAELHFATHWPLRRTRTLLVLRQYDDSPAAEASCREDERGLVRGQGFPIRHRRRLWL